MPLELEMHFQFHNIFTNEANSTKIGNKEEIEYNFK